MTKYIVRYKSINGLFPMYAGGPGLDVNAGVRVRSKSTIRREDAISFTSLDAAKRKARNCNPTWFGEVLDAATDAVVYTTLRGRKKP
jgi:hypothetical protein